MSELATAFKRMRWRCRRGMRELDVLLVGWLDRHEQNMSSSEQQAFEQLLDQSDMDLYVWFTRRGQPEESALIALVAGILAMPRDDAVPLA